MAGRAKFDVGGARNQRGVRRNAFPKSGGGVVSVVLIRALEEHSLAAARPPSRSIRRRTSGAYRGLKLPAETTLPIAGKGGTISTRLRATRAEANTVAKTDSISNVRAVSGYVCTRDLQ